MDTSLADQAAPADDHAAVGGDGAVVSEDRAVPHVDRARGLEGEPVVEDAAAPETHVGPAGHREPGARAHVAQRPEGDTWPAEPGDGEAQSPSQCGAHAVGGAEVRRPRVLAELVRRHRRTLPAADRVGG